MNYRDSEVGRQQRRGHIDFGAMICIEKLRIAPVTDNRRIIKTPTRDEAHRPEIADNYISNLDRYL